MQRIGKSFQLMVGKLTINMQLKPSSALKIGSDIFLSAGLDSFLELACAVRNLQIAS